MRSGGSSPAEIAAAGGGMTSTVTVTRGTDPWTLCNAVRARLRNWLLSGTTTIEAKTGYHLTRDGELADVRLLRSLEGEHGHAARARHLPGRARRAAGVLRPPSRLHRRGQRLVRRRGRRRRRQRRRLLRRGAVHRARGALGARRRAGPSGLLPRLHACGDSRNGAARLAAEIGCASADLLHGADDEDVAALAKAGVTAVVCPATGCRRRPDPAGPGAARPGRHGRARLRPLAGRRTGSPRCRWSSPRGRQLRHERHRGAARGDRRRRARPARTRPGRDGPRPATRTSWPGTPITRAPSPGPTASSRTGCGAAASRSALG